MLQDDFIRVVIELCRKASMQGFAPVQGLIGDGVLVVKDVLGEYDTYFDMDKWEYIYPQIWEGGLDNSNGVGLLPGTGRYPAVKSFDDAIQFAGQHLRSKDHVWKLYDHPTPVTPQPQQTTEKVKPSKADEYLRYLNEGFGVYPEGEVREND